MNPLKNELVVLEPVPPTINGSVPDVEEAVVVPVEITAPFRYSTQAVPLRVTYSVFHVPEVSAMADRKTRPEEVRTSILFVALI